ncbi:MAG: DEAD/DEAH box helicase [Bacteroidales bacterium]|nr:DEAD/DEAH box helicase [Candidatus Scybalocola fimicaballi]
MKFAILVSSDLFFDGVFQSALLNENSNGSYDVIRLISDGDGVVETLSETEKLLVRKTTNYEPETIFRLFIKKAKYSISVYNTEMAKLKVVYDDKSNPRRNDSVFSKILNYIDGQTKEIYSILAANPDILLAVRQPHAKQILKSDTFTISDEKSKVHPKFTFLDDGSIRYSMSISHSNQIIPLGEIERKNVRIVCTNPCMAVFMLENDATTYGSRILSFENAKSSILAPFFSNPYIPVKPESVDKYCGSFILDQLSKFDVILDGIECVKVKTSPIIRLTIYKALNNRSVLRPTVEYINENEDENENHNGHVFSYSLDNSAKGIEYAGIVDGHPKFFVVERDLFKENEIMDDLYATGLVMTEGYLTTEDNTSECNIYQWITEYDGLFDKVIIDAPNFIPMEPHLVYHHDVIGDWFDLKIYVEVGDEKIRFKDIAALIKNGEHIFHFGDGRFFIIPDIWFSTYADLAKVASASQGDNIKLHRSSSALLETVLEKKEMPMLTNVKVEVPNFVNATLRKYQVEGFHFLVNHYLSTIGCILLDDMGLGKTLQTIAMLAYVHRDSVVKRKSVGAGFKPARQENSDTTNMVQRSLFEDFESDNSKTAEINTKESEAETKDCTNDESTMLQASLVVVPASLLTNWRRELEKFCPSLTVYTHAGKDRKKNLKYIFKTYDIVLVSSNLLQKDSHLFVESMPETMVIDESHKLKNANTKFHHAISGIKPHFVVGLSGTPIENSIVDLHSQFAIINPYLLGSLTEFKKAYMKGDNLPVESREAIGRVIAPHTLRRTRDEVLGDLPPLTEIICSLDMDEQQAEMYEIEKSAARNEVMKIIDSSESGVKALTALIRLRKLALHPKMYDETYNFENPKTRWIIDFLKELREEKHKVIIFATFSTYFDYLYEELAKSGISSLIFTGETKNPDQVLDQFQNDNSVTALLTTYQKGGTGLNLTAASYVIHAEQWYNPQLTDQATARAHRSGQTKPVTSYHLLLKDSIDEKIFNLAKKKREVANGTLDMAKMSAEMALDLI